MVEFKNVTKIYNRKVLALNNVSLKIESGEFVFIVGASGSGKSTLLKLMTKEETANSGEIIINGTNLSKLRPKDVPYLRRTLGIVFQDFRLIDKMTVFENVAFAMHTVEADPKEIRKRVAYVLNLVGLSSKINRLPSELSGGEQQRVGLARALVNNPNMIIADEPTGNIDSSMSYEIVSLLGQINKCGTTVIMVTHDLTIVKQFPHRVIELCCGDIKKVERGEKSED